MSADRSADSVPHRYLLDLSIEDYERYLEARYPSLRPTWTTPGEIRVAYAVAREAERVAAIRLSNGHHYED